MSRYFKRNDDKIIPNSTQDIFEEPEIFQEEEEIDSFSHQVIEVIFNVLGKKISNYSKEEMNESFSHILQTSERKIHQKLNYQQQDCFIPPRTLPSINIIYGNPSFSYNNFAIPTYNTYQPQLPATQANPYPYTAPLPYPMASPMQIPNQMQMPIQIPQLPIGNFSQPLVNLHKPVKKNDKKKSKKKDKKRDKKKDEKKSKKSSNSIECQNGVFQYYFDKFGANPTTNGYVKIDGNSLGGSDYTTLLQGLLDPKNSGILANNGPRPFGMKTSAWASKDEPNSHITIEFLKSFVKITKYKLTVGNRDGNSYFTSWVLTGFTQDGKKIDLDTVNNLSEIYDKHTTITREVNCKKLIRSVKLTMKGEGSWKKYPHRMIMRNIEIYGSLFDNSK